MRRKRPRNCFWRGRVEVVTQLQEWADVIDSGWIKKKSLN